MCGDLSHRAAHYPSHTVEGKGTGTDNMLGGRVTPFAKGKGKKGQYASQWSEGKGKCGEGPYRSCGLWDTEERYDKPGLTFGTAYFVQSERGFP